jgi:hypothetical protein
MTFGAMARCVRQIGASVPLRGLRDVGPERRIVEKQQLPQADGAADAEGKFQSVAGRGAGNSRQGFEIGEEIAQVFGAHCLI